MIDGCCLLEPPPLLLLLPAVLGGGVLDLEKHGTPEAPWQDGDGLAQAQQLGGEGCWAQCSAGALEAEAHEQRARASALLSSTSSQP